MIEKARSGGASDQGTTLTDETCSYLVAVIARDLGVLEQFGELPQVIPSFFGNRDLSALAIPGTPFLPLMEKLVTLKPDADTFFACLASLHKRRCKYERILQTQPIPTIEQVGPRGLLQYGTLPASALAGLLFWRKWFFDIDNRAGQETGYLFEPIIANAIGGAPFGSKASPIRRASDPTKGRQADCIRERRAYEFKIRVTIASSGQGRWQEELDFPVDCRASGYTPILIVLDATPNPKLEQLESAFLAQQGVVYTGDGAWRHLEDMAGETMALFLDTYVRVPIQTLLNEVTEALPDFSAVMRNGNIAITIGGDRLLINRTPGEPVDVADELPDDAAEQIPGP